jgi:hypothetical protein
MKARQDMSELDAIWESLKKAHPNLPDDKFQKLFEQEVTETILRGENEALLSEMAHAVSHELRRGSEEE